MKVILLQNVEKIGKKNDVKEVSSGFARNFLLSKGLAVLATSENLQKLEFKEKAEEARAEEELKEAEKAVAKLDGQEIEIDVKVGKEGQLFQSITKQKISERLTEMGFKVEKEQIDLEHPIKESGEFPIKIRLNHNLEAEIKIIITGKEEE
ncbi:MAG: 50S ribosomal protein L9 [Candidatus Pacebacteria bacterium]|nr:50S ribosomal protein L9 [Candidatus Paceibacterota bacterium]